MKSMAELTRNYQRPPQVQEPKPQKAHVSVPQSAVLLVNRIFSELQVIFPAWRVAFPNQDTLNNAKRTWTVALFENGVHHTRQIEFGLKKARKSGCPHIPSVGEFIKWCFPSAEDLSLPSPEEAFKMLSYFRDEDWRKTLPEIVLATFNQINHWDLANLHENKLYPIFERHYRFLLEKVALGEDISGLCPKVLPKPEEVTVTAEEELQTRMKRMSILQDVKRKHFKGAK